MSEWKEHDGRERPVDKWATVDVRLRSGEETTHLPDDSMVKKAHYLEWKHDGSQTDILFYREVE